MNFRCDLNINEGHRMLVLSPQREETFEHIALKLSAYILFWDRAPQLDLSLKHPMLQGQDFKPDFMAFNAAGHIGLWGECGNVSLHKINKLTRRYPEADVIVIKSSEEDGRRFLREAEDQVSRREKLQVWSWPKADFQTWRGALKETTHIVGEARGASLNVVVNSTPLYVELKVL